MQHVSPLKPPDTFLVLRFGMAFLMFTAIGLMAAPSGAAASLAAPSVLALALILSFNHPFELPTDYTDVLFTMLFVVAARRGSKGLALVSTLLGASGRESAAFAGIIWACCAPSDRWPRWVFGGVLSAAAMTTATALRFYFRLPGGRLLNSVGVSHTQEWIANAVHSMPGPRSWWVGLLSLVVLLAWWLSVVRLWGPVDRKLVRAATLIAAITLVIGTASELRIYVPTATCVLLAGLPSRIREHA